MSTELIRSIRRIMSNTSHILIEMKQCFMKCQEGQHTHPQLVKRLAKVFKTVSVDEFFGHFVHCMNYFLVEYRREPAVERGIDLVTKFAVSLVTVSDPGQDVEQGPLPDFVLMLFQYLLQHHNASSRGVRFRCCQLVHKLLHNLGENAQIDDDLYDDIFRAMMTRLRDKFPVVRVHAIQALTRLQDPNDSDCPVIKALMFLMTCDPHPDVRKAALSNIALSKKTLREVVSRTRDVKENIRVTAYKILAEKVHIKALSIAQRVKLLQDGLSDRSGELGGAVFRVRNEIFSLLPGREAVKESCGKGLLQTWLTQYGGNVLEVLERLDVEESHATVAKALEQLYKHCDSERLVKDFDIVDDKCVIPVEKLTCENTFYWRSLCQHLRKQGDCTDELMEKVLPTPVDFCKYLASAVDSHATMASIDDQLRNEFILSQLVQLVGCFDLADAAGRNAVEEQLKQLLLDDNISERLVAPLVKQLRGVHVVDEKKPVPYEPAHINKLVEIIADIRVPVTSPASQTDTSAAGKEDRRKMELKAAAIRVKLNQLREEMNDSVENQNFSRAAELKDEIAALENERDVLLNESLTVENTVVEETRMERNDPSIVLKCLTIASEMLYHLKMTGLNPVLRTLMETLIITGIMTEEALVRKEAIRALGLCALQEKQTAKEHFLLFLQICQVDIETIRVMAMTAVFDVIMTYGLETFETNKADDGLKDGDKPRTLAETDEVGSDASGRLLDSEEQTESQETRTVQSIMSVMTSWIDNESSEIRTCAAKGLAKLMATGRVSSPRLLSRLMILWYNPMTEDDTMLRHFLGTFFPVFAFDSPSNQEIVEESFLLTLRTLLDAPSSSPLSAVNVKNVLDLLMQLCDWRHLAVNRVQATDNMLEHNIHNSLAIKLCNEILSDKEQESISVLCWALNQLSLQPGELATLHDLLALVKRICKTMQNRVALRNMERFLKTVQSLIEEQPPATPLSQSRKGPKSRVHSNQFGDGQRDDVNIHETIPHYFYSQPSDPEPTIDDYTPPVGANTRPNDPSHHVPSNIEDPFTSGSEEPLPGNAENMLPGDEGCHGVGRQDSQSEERSVVSESSQSDVTEISESIGAGTRRSRKTKTARSGPLQSSSNSSNVRRSARKKVVAQPMDDSESENSSNAFVTPDESHARSARAASQRTRSQDSDDASDDSDTIGPKKGKRKAPTVLSDIENELV